jgi:hypothetical protein
VKVGVVGVGAVGAATALSPTVDVRAGDYDALAGIGAVSARLAEAAMTSDERAALERSAAALRQAARRVPAVRP